MDSIFVACLRRTVNIWKAGPVVNSGRALFVYTAQSSQSSPSLADLFPLHVVCGLIRTIGVGRHIVLNEIQRQMKCRALMFFHGKYLLFSSQSLLQHQSIAPASSLNQYGRVPEPISMELRASTVSSLTGPAASTKRLRVWSAASWKAYCVNAGGARSTVQR